MEIYQSFLIINHSVSEKRFLNAFYEINDRLWHQYNIGEVDRNYIKEYRFKTIFKHLNLDQSISQEVSSYFLSHCPLKPYLMPDTLVALNYLQPKYSLHIITNGFLDSQTSKIKNSGISKYFEVVVTSECVHARKPSKEIFEYALTKAGASKQTSIMIGDNPKTDIIGAKGCGIKTILYDPAQNQKSLADYSISSHLELSQIL